MEMKHTVEEIYSKGSFCNVARSKIIRLFYEKKEELVNSGGKKSFVEAVGKINNQLEEGYTVPLKPIANLRVNRGT